MAAHAPYVESGRSGAAWLLPFVGFAAAAVVACVYSHTNTNLDALTPSDGLGRSGWNFKLLIAGVPVLHILLCPLLGVAVAVPVAFAGLPLRVRSTSAMRLHGAVAGVAAVWFAWACDFWLARFDSEPPAATAVALWDLVDSPAMLWGRMNSLANAGRDMLTVHMGASVLWTLWAFELLLVVAAAAWWAPRVVRGRAFCEPCGRWLVADDAIRVSSRGVADYRVRREGIACLGQSPGPEPGDGEWFWIRAWRCPTCTTTVVFRVDKVLGCPVRNPAQYSPGASARLAHPLVPPSTANDADRAMLQQLGGAPGAEDRAPGGRSAKPFT